MSRRKHGRLGKLTTEQRRRKIERNARRARPRYEYVLVEGGQFRFRAVVS